MIVWRRETILDIYILALAVVLCVAPSLFPHTLGTPRTDDWTAACW